jgi:hypothetical protein
MGLFEYLRVQIRKITGRDPELDGESSGLYKFYSATDAKTPNLPASGDKPFKNFAISPVQGTPGMCYDPTGAVRYVHDSTGKMVVYTLPYGYSPNVTLPALGTATATDLFWLTPRIGLVSVALDGAGAGSSTLVPALPGYTPVCRIRTIYGTAGGAETSTITCTGGTVVGPAVHGPFTTIAGKAVAMGEPGVTFKGTDTTDDGKPLVITIAGALLSQTIWFEIVYWYE